MMRVNLVLNGFGNVGKAFFRLVEEKKDFCRKRYSLDLEWSALLRRESGVVFTPEKRKKLAAAISVPDYAAALAWGKKPVLEDILQKDHENVLVDCAVSDNRTGEPGYERIMSALKEGWHVVTADKGPLVFGWKRLRDEAYRNGRSLKMSGAAGAALPALDLATKSIAAARIISVEGILNGTTNYLLTRMMEGGLFSDVLAEAQEMGIAEPDPSNDIGGWDTAAKILLISNAVCGTDLNLDDVKVEGVTSIPESVITSCVLERKKLKLLGRMRYEGEEVKLEVVLALIDESHPLYGVDGVDKGITFVTDTMGKITLTGGKSDPKGAAAALLKDIVNIYLR